MPNQGEQILRAAQTVLVVDWPSRDVPESLARVGLAVVISGGPEPDNYSAYELRDGEIVIRHLGQRPRHDDLVYSHRPIEDLPRVVALAQDVGASAVWTQSGVTNNGVKDSQGCWMSDEHSRAARTIVESAGLAYVEAPYIGSVARKLTVRE